MPSACRRLRTRRHRATIRRRRRPSRPPNDTQGIMAMFLTKKHISRRATLKGMGVTVALPLLDAMIPAATALAATAATPKPRAGFFYIPHGMIMDNTPYGKEVDAWTPSGSGADFTLNKIM